MIVQATVQRSRIHPEIGLPYMEHRTLIDGVWGWSEFLADANIFSDWQLAEDHVTLLKSQGEKKVYPFAHEEQKQQILIKHKGKPPEEVYAELEKRGLA